MKINGNANLKLGLPGGAYREDEELKSDYNDLTIQAIERKGNNRLRFDTLYGKRVLHIWLWAENTNGEEDIRTIENKKDKLIGKQVIEAIDTNI